MLRITDTYFLGSFIKTLGFSLLAFIVIFIVVDLVGLLDSFIDKNVPVSVIVMYYVYYLPYMIVLVLPVAMLMASLFTTGQFVRHGELTALKAVGISLYRVFLPVLVFAALVSGFSFWFGENVVPVSERKRADLRRYEINKTSRRFTLDMRNIKLQETRNRIVTIAHYDGSRQTAFQVAIQERQGTKIISSINAERMVPYDSAWKLQNVKIREFSLGKEIFSEEKELVIDDFSFTTSDLESVQIKPEEMNIFELHAYIRKLHQMGKPFGRWIVDFHGKISFPFANIIVVLLGLPLATRNWRGGAAVGFGLSLFICFLYYVLISLSTALGYKGAVSPVIAAWSSNTLFGAVGLASLITAKK